MRWTLIRLEVEHPGLAAAIYEMHEQVSWTSRSAWGWACFDKPPVASDLGADATKALTREAVDDSPPFDPSPARHRFGGWPEALQKNAWGALGHVAVTIALTAAAISFAHLAPALAAVLGLAITIRRVQVFRVEAAA